MIKFILEHFIIHIGFVHSETHRLVCHLMISLSISSPNAIVGSDELIFC